MSISLRDQLLQAGFKAKPIPAKKIKRKPKPKTVLKSKKVLSQKVNRLKKLKKQADPNLASLYQQRATLEKKEREDAIQRKREAARLRKQNGKKIRKLITDNYLKRTEANIRYNFIVGKSIKYLYVTEKQQQALSAGELSITFLDGKRLLIPVEIAAEIKQLNPNKIVVTNIN